MKVYTTDNVKNVVLLGHSGSGKTTLAECMLFEAGKINRRGSVTDKNTVADYHEIEQERGNTIFTSLMHMPWKTTKINLLDTPGFDDFVSEVASSLKVADTGLMLLNAQNGVEVGTELIWDYSKKFKKPMIFAVNHVDQEKADFDTTVEQAKSRFGSGVTVVQYPLNQGEGFNTIVDVLKMTMYEFPAEGGKPEKKPIPESEKAKADKLHNDLVESIAEHDEGLMEKYFDKGSLDEEEMTKGLHGAMANRDLFPLFCISAQNNMGSGRIMGFINDIAPGPKDQPFKVKDKEENHPVSADAPVSLFVYKTISEPHLGDMSFFKVTSGILKAGTDLENMTTQSSERLNQLFLLDGKNRTQIEELHAGDIGATVKLKNTHTNDTLSLKGSDIILEPIPFPSTRIRTAVKAVNSGDEEKMAVALNKLHQEDPSIIIEQSKELKQTILSGQGELQLQIIKDKIANNYKVDIEYEKPRIPYRETIRKSVKKDYRHKKQSGGAGQFGEVHMLVEPYFEGAPHPADLNVRKEEFVDLPWGGKLNFLWCIVGGAIDVKYSNAIMKGVMEKLENGPLTGSYVRDVRVAIYDGKMHAVDSNDMAFKLAATNAFKSAFVEASPQLLEPVYDIEVLVPEEIMGDIMSDLQTRRATIMGMDAEGHYQKIKAKVPLSELYKYSSTLRSLSQGRAKHNRAFSEYSALTPEIQNQLVKAYQAEQEA